MKKPFLHNVDDHINSYKDVHANVFTGKGRYVHTHVQKRYLMY